MFERIKRRRLKGEESAQLELLNAPIRGKRLSVSLDHSVSLMRELFRDVDTMIFRPIINSFDEDLRFCLLYSDGVVDNSIINEHFVKPLLLTDQLRPGPQLAGEVMDSFIMSGDVKKTGDMNEIIQAVTYGDTLLMIDGCDQGLLLNSKSFSIRGITEPEGEKVLSGPREGFGESIMVNLSMVRRRLRTNQFKVKFRSMGEQTNTQVCVCYLENIVNKDILAQLERRLDEIDIDGVLDANYITEFISPPSQMGYSTIGYTERPDVVVAKMLEGRIAIMVDGSPAVLTAPYLFVENFQSNEDYYMSSIYSSFARFMRMISYFLTTTIAALYIAVVCYHPEIMPPSLMINISSERDSVPLPAAVEAFIMLIVFDILRETGVRMPSHVGQALSIVGALVIGQAAVEAKLVAAPMIIVVAFAGITNLLVPRLSASGMVCRYFLLLLASILGLVGLIAGIAVCVIHVLGLESLGVPQATPLVHMRYQEVKDTLIRAPWPRMLTRSPLLTQNRTRIRRAKG